MRILCIAGAIIVCASAGWSAREIGRYGFRPGAAAGLDGSGFGHHGKLSEKARPGPEGSLDCAGDGWLVLPSGADFWGAEADRGSVSVWVKPEFDPGDLSSGAWDGYSMIFYAMQTDGNGLPDGYDEIGIWCHGPYLHAKVSRSSAAATFRVDSPMRKGQWTHLALCWKPGLRELYIDGELVDQDGSAYEPPRLDEFPAMLGQHSSSSRWAWRGELADCRMFDDALTADEVTRLASKREPGEGELAVTKGQAVLERVDWGEPWLGEQMVSIAAGAKAEGTLEALCEVLSAGGREVFEARALDGVAEGARVPFTVRDEGSSRINLLVQDKATGRIVAGASRFVNVPELAPTLRNIDRGVGKLEVLLNREWTPQVVRDELLPRQEGLAKELDAIQAAKTTARAEDVWQELIGKSDDLLARLEKTWELAMLYSAGAKDGKLPEYGIGIENALVKYLKEDTFAGEYADSIELKACCDEYEAAQVLVFALDKTLENVTLELSDLAGPDGATIPRESIRWNRVGYVETKEPTYKVRHVGLWPDPLLPAEAFGVERESFESVWLTVYVPRGAEAGDYEGTVTVRPENAEARQVALRLHVWDFALPEQNSLVSAFGLNSMGGQYQVDVDKYVENARRHRVSLGFPGAVFAAAKVEHPAFDFAGQKLRCKIKAESPEGAQAPGAVFLICQTAGQTAGHVYGPIKPREGQWTDVEFTMRDDERPTQVAFEYRAAGPVELTISAIGVGGRVFDGTDRPEYWQASGPWTSVAKGSEGLVMRIAAPQPGEPLIDQWPGIVRMAADTPADTQWRLDFTEFDERIEKYLEQGINAIPLPLPGCPRHITEEEARRLVRENSLGPIARAYQEHLEEKGWLQYAYTYVADEPEADAYPALNVWHGTIREYAPKLRNMMTARSFPAELEYVDIWCPEIYSFNPKSAADEQAKGKLVWWYPAFSTRHPFPDFWIDYPLIDNRMVFWLTWKHKLDGLLYWSVSNWWRADPWKDPMTFPGANGDGTLVYPGPDGGPVDSIRWEAIRDGAEDYEYFVLLRDALAAARDSGKAPDDLVARAQGLLAIDDTVAKSWREWSFDAGRLIDTRNQMGETIEKLLEVAR